MHARRPMAAMPRLQTLFTGAVAFVLTACAAHKVEPEGNIQPFAAGVASGKPNAAARGSKTSPLSIVAVSPAQPGPRVHRCTSPIWSVVSLGIIPSFCEDSFVVLQGDRMVGQYHATTMTGWAAMFVSVTPAWQMGSGDDRVTQSIRSHVLSTAPAR